MRGKPFVLCRKGSLVQREKNASRAIANNLHAFGTGYRAAAPGGIIIRMKHEALHWFSAWLAQRRAIQVAKDINTRYATSLTKLHSRYSRRKSIGSTSTQTLIAALMSLWRRR